MKRVDLFDIDGDLVEVPANERGEFEAATENKGIKPREVEQWEVDGDRVDVPVDEREEFLSSIEESRRERVRAVNVGGDTVEVPDSERKEFLDAWRKDERFAGERDEIRAEVEQKLAGALNQSAGQWSIGESIAESEKHLLKQGYVALPFTLGEKMFDGLAFLSRPLDWATKDYFDWSGGFKDKATAIADKRVEWLGERPEDSLISMTGDIMNSINESLLTGGVGKAIGVTSTVSKVSLQTMLYALSQAESTAGKAELARLNQAQQMGLGMAAGITEGTLEWLSQHFGMQKSARAALTGDVAKRVLERAADALGEGVTEGLQSLGTTFWEKLGGLDDRTGEQIAKEVAMEFSMGVLAGGLMESAEGIALGLDTRVSSRSRADDNTGVYDNPLTPADVIEAADVDVVSDGLGVLTLLRKGGGEENAADHAPLQVRGVGFKRLENGEKVRVARVVDAQGSERFVYDRGLVDLADYYLRFGKPGVTTSAAVEKMNAADENQQEGGEQKKSQQQIKRESEERFKEFSNKVGFPVKPGKRVFVMLGRSLRPYKATVVAPVDAGHVRIYVGKTQRSEKNRQAGYQIVGGEGMREFTVAKRLREISEQMKEVPKEQRKEVQAKAKEFRELVMGEPELFDYQVFSMMHVPGRQFSSRRESAIALAREFNNAYQMLAEMWGEKELDLSNPVRRAEKLEELKELLQGYDAERSMVESAPTEELPEMVELRSFRDSLYNELNRQLAQPIDYDFVDEAAMAKYRAYVAELEQQVSELDIIVGGGAGAERTAARVAWEEDARRQRGEHQSVDSELNEIEDEPGVEGWMFARDSSKKNTKVRNRRPETREELERHYGVRLAEINLFNQGSGGGGLAGENTESGRFRAAKLGSFGMDLRDAVMFFMDIYDGRRAKVRKKTPGNHPGVMRYSGSDVDIFLATRIFGLVSVEDVQRIRKEIEQTGSNLDDKGVDKIVRKRLLELIEQRKKEPMKAPVKVLLHEIAHVVDYLPDFNFPGGNVFGHIMNLGKQLKRVVPGWLGGPEPMTTKEQSELRKRVEKEVAAEFEKLKSENTAGITAEDIQNLMRQEAGKSTPELYDWFARQDSTTKREVLQAALKGVVSEQLKKVGIKKSVQGVSPEAYKQAVKKRYGELWRAEVERRYNLEIKVFKEQAFEVIKWWNGSELGIKYFMNDPAEMYAQLFSVFLGDPAGLEQRAPMVWRAFNGYMDARPEIRDIYNKYQVQRHSGMSRQREHVARLVESFAIKHNEDQYAKLIKEMNTPGSGENLMQARFLFDRITGPLYMVVKKANKLAGDTERSRAQRDQIFGRVKDVLHSINTVRLMLIDIHDQVSTKLKEAGLNWWNLAEYAFHGRVVNELDGRAASYGWEPKTSSERLREMQENEFSADQWNTLQQSWQNFRKIYEQFALNGTGVREMLGDDIHDLLMKNVHYVTFKHVPTPAEVGKTMEERRKIAEEHGKDAVTAYDIVNVEMARKYGDQSAHIYELKGSFDPLADPLTASIQKAAKLMEAGLINDLKLQVVSFLRESGFQGMRPAKRGSGGKLESVNDSRRKTVYFMQNGKMQGVVMSKWLAESLDFGRGIDKIAMLQPLMKVNQTMAALYTRLRYGFWEPAYEKDKQSAVANIKGLKRSPLASLPWVWGAHPGALFTRYMPDSVIDFIAGNKLTSWMLNDSHFEFYESQARRVGILVENGGFEAKINEAQQLEQQGNIKQAQRIREDVAIARRVLKSNILMVMQDVTMPGQGLSEYDRKCAKYGLKLDHEQAGNAWEYIKNHVDTAWQGYTRLGEIRENTTKIASMLYLERKSELNPAQIKTTVSELGGSPDFSERGLAAGYAEFIIKPFLNARKEGMARSIKAAKDHPGDYAMSKMAYTVAPTTLRWMLASGALVALIKQAVDDDDLLENSWAFQSLKRLSNKYSYVSDYLSKNYITAVLPYDMGDDCALVMTIPMDETEQAFSGLVWAGLDSIADGIFNMDVKKTDKNMLESAVYPLLTDYLPGAGGGPLISGIWPWINTYFRSAHTMDTFMGHNVLSDDELKRKYSKPDAAKKLAGHTWNAFGGGTIWNWKPPEQRLNMTKAEEILNAPGIQPFLGRYIRIVRNGRAQNLSVIEGDAENTRADTRLTARNLFIKGLQNDKFYTEEVVKHIQSDGYFSDYYTDLVRKYYDQSTPKKKEFDALKKASKRDPEQLRRIMKKIESWD